MSSRFRAVALVGVGLGIGLLVGVGMMIGAVVAANMAGDSSGGFITLPETPIHATASDSGDTFAIATGPIDDEIEGLFTVDAMTGILQCLVVNPRSGEWSVFSYNVTADLEMGGGKGAQLLIVTGGWSTRALGTGAGRPADSLVYVADTKTGNVGVYYVPWNRSLPATGKAQGGTLVKLAVGKVRTLVVRD